MAQHFLDPAHTEGATKCVAIPTRMPTKIWSFGFIPEYSDLLVGDLVLYAAVKPNLGQRRIKDHQFTAMPEHDAAWTHASVYIGDYTICEATARGIKVTLLLDSILDYKLRFRRPRLNGEERWRLAIRALTRLRQPYDWGAIVQAVGSFMSSGANSPSARRNQKAAICSQLYADAFAEASGKLITQVPGNIVTPGDLSRSSELDDIQVRWAALH